MTNLAFLRPQEQFDHGLIQRFSSLREMYAASVSQEHDGIGIVRQAYSLEAFHEELETMAGFIDDDTFDKVRVIAYDPSKPHSIAESLDAHPMHTDATFSSRQLERFMLHFKVIDNDHGGVSTFMPISWILDQIPRRHLEALQLAEVSYVRLGDANIVKAFRGPILKLKSDGGVIFRWRYDDKVRPLVLDTHGVDAEAAIQWVKDFIERTPPSITRPSVTKRYWSTIAPFCMVAPRCHQGHHAWLGGHGSAKSRATRSCLSCARLCIHACEIRGAFAGYQGPSCLPSGKRRPEHSLCIDRHA